MKEEQSVFLTFAQHPINPAKSCSKKKDYRPPNPGGGWNPGGTPEPALPPPKNEAALVRAGAARVAEGARFIGLAKPWPCATTPAFEGSEDDTMPPSLAAGSTVRGGASTDTEIMVSPLRIIRPNARFVSRIGGIFVDESPEEAAFFAATRDFRVALNSSVSAKTIFMY